MWKVLKLGLISGYWLWLPGSKAPLYNVYNLGQNKMEHGGKGWVQISNLFCPSKGRTIRKVMGTDSGQNKICPGRKKKISTLHVQKNLASLKNVTSLPPPSLY